MMKTYYDITITTNSDEMIKIKGIGNTSLNGITYNECIKSITIDRQYQKKTRQNLVKSNNLIIFTIQNNNMGKMKELFIEQMNAGIYEQPDNDTDYEQEYESQYIENLNESIRLKYSDNDVQSILESVLGEAMYPLTYEIMAELNNLNNLRNGYTDGNN